VVHDLAAGFALDALDDDEADEFGQHLAICPDCEDELAGLRVAAVALAFAGELAVPPTRLRERVLDVGAPVIPLPRHRRPQLAAAVAVVAAAVIAIALRPWDDGGSLGGMKRFTAQGAKATLLVDRSGEAVLSVRRLPPPPAGKAYEIWVIAGGRPAPAGWVRGTLAVLTRPVPPGASVAVSVEPVAGSRKPTGPLVLRAETT
jgi:Anti-sigma-K factor rskA, C-terminal/Putative zinc-finger